MISTQAGWFIQLKQYYEPLSRRCIPSREPGYLRKGQVSDLKRIEPVLLELLVFINIHSNIVSKIS
jgi:hypothetical protein